MAKEFDEKLYDRRIVNRNIKNAVISSKDHERYLKSLEDDASNAVSVATHLGSSGQTPRDAEGDDE
jgi:hypothetical protein